ncbi:hypothetical protein ACFE04_009033 [Oxalis oulophora]
MDQLAMKLGDSLLSAALSSLVDKAASSDLLKYARKKNIDVNVTTESQAGSSSKMRALIPSYCTSFTPRVVFSNVKIGSKLEQITIRLEQIVKYKNDLGLMENSNAKLEERQPTTSLVDQSRIYGRDADKERIVQLLLGVEATLLQEKLKEKLSTRKFLIVVDDLWNENVDNWEILCHPFRTGVVGCKLLVTTRNESVVSTLDATSVYHLGDLSREDSLSLLESYALGKEAFDQFPGLKDIEMDVGEAYNKDENVRHLSFLSSRYDILKRFKNISELKQLRTFLALYKIKKKYYGTHNLSYDVLHKILPEFKCLKLDLAYTKSLQEMPSGISSLTNLHTLSKFIVGKCDKHQIRDLQGLTRLRGKLSIYGLDNVQDVKDVRSANLQGKEGLNDITLIWSDEFYDSRNEALEMKVLDLLQPNENLKVLQIESYGGNHFSSWLGNHRFANMERINLLRCKKSKSLPSLGELPLLKYLRIEGMDRVETVDREFYGSKCFPNLKTLEFENMLNWYSGVDIGEDTLASQLKE